LTDRSISGDDEGFLKRKKKKKTLFGQDGNGSLDKGVTIIKAM